MNQFSWTVIAIACCAFVLAPRVGMAATPTALSLATGQSVVLPAAELVRVAVGDGKIAGVVPIGTREVLVNGKASGTTTLFLWTRDGRRDYVVTVIDQGLTTLRRMISAAIVVPGVHIDAIDRTLVATGAVTNLDDVVAVGDVLSRFTPIAAANTYTLVNAVTVAHPMLPLQTLLAGMPASQGVSVDRDATGNIIVSGTVLDRTTAEMVLSKARALGGPYLAADGKVIDHLQTTTTSQVDIKVYILEIDATGLSQLGVNLQSANYSATTPGFTLGTAVFPIVEANGAIGKALTIGSFFRSSTLAPTINLIVNSGHGRILSSPNLVTMPGHQAQFLVGGQIPIPVSTGPQQVAIEYKDFGVKLAVTPTILENGNVESIIAPEVSNLDFADGVSLNGFVVPALKISRLSTDVITKDGESIVMGGLVSRVEQTTISKIPLLGDLPILGKLFRSKSYQTSQTDVVFVMTPTILAR